MYLESEGEVRGAYSRKGQGKEFRQAFDDVRFTSIPKMPCPKQGVHIHK